MKKTAQIYIFLTFLLLTIPTGNTFSQNGYEPDLSLSLTEFSEKVLQPKEEIWVIDFWASWCGPCIQAVPHMKEMHEKFSGKNVRFISISWDQNDQMWRNAIYRLKMPWNQIIVPMGEEAFLNENFPHKGMPTIFVVDSNGKRKKVSDYNLEKVLTKMTD